MASVETESVSLNGDSEKIDKEKAVDAEDKKVENVKTNENGADPISDLEIKIIDQIEYYFGDCNLPRDKFLQQQIKLDDGWVPLEVMAKFNRLSKLSTDLKFIASALKKSTSGLMEISEDNTKIRRSPSQALPEMNEARRQELLLRSLYVKGFPTEGVEVDNLLDFFRKFAKVEQIVMRKHLDKAVKKWIFKGSVFAVFPSVEEAEKVLKLENLKYNDSELLVKWQKNYVEEKRNARVQSRLENQNKKRKLKEEEKHDEEGGGEDEEKKDSLAKGAALYLSDCPSELTREDVKSKIEELGIGVAYMYFSKGDTEGWVRLQEADSAAEVLKNLKDGKLEVKDTSVSVRALEGEEEIKFLERVKGDMAKRRNQNKKPKGKGKIPRSGKGGAFWRKRRGSPTREGGSISKKAAVEKSE